MAENQESTCIQNGDKHCPSSSVCISLQSRIRSGQGSGGSSAVKEHFPGPSSLVTIPVRTVTPVTSAP